MMRRSAVLGLQTLNGRGSLPTRQKSVRGRWFDAAGLARGGAFRRDEDVCSLPVADD